MKYKYSEQITLGYDADGKRIRKRIYSNSKNDLLNQKIELIERHRNGGLPVKVTFGEYAAVWLETYKVNCEPATIRSYERAVARCELIHAMDVASVTPLECQRIINMYKDHPDTAKKTASALRQIFKQLLKEGRIQRDPTVSLQLPKAKKTKKRVLLPAEKEAVRDLLKAGDKRLPDHKKMFLGVLYYLGLRPEEARALMVSDIDWDKQEITIQRALSFTDEIGDLKGTKTDNIRVLPIPVSFLGQFKAYCEGIGRMYLFVKVSDNKLHTKTSYRRLWDSIASAISSAAWPDGISPAGKLTPYAFRRNYATFLYYSGISLKKAAYLMGHSNTRMIMEVYAQIDDERENIDALRAIV